MAKSCKGETIVVQHFLQKTPFIQGDSMKTNKMFYLLILALALTACGPSQYEIQTQTAVAKTSIAESWTATPTVTPTFTPTPTYTPTLTPTPTKTPLPTATLMGGGQGQIIFISYTDWDEYKSEIFSINSRGTNLKQLTDLGGYAFGATWSPNGDKIFFTFQKNRNDVSQLYTMNPDGTDITKVSINDQRNYSSPDISPDGEKIVFMSHGETPSTGKTRRQTIFIMDADGSNEVQLITDPPKNMLGEVGPSWSPDGKKIIFFSYTRGQILEIFTINPDGTEQKQLTTMNHYLSSPSWSPDGKYIVFIKGLIHNADIYRMNSDGTDIVRLTKNGENDSFPRFSPDGTKIYWNSCCFNLSIMNLDGADITKIYSEHGRRFTWRP